MSIKRIDIVHHLHTDLGYTDHPLRARELHAQFVGQAVDAVLQSTGESYPFAWTCETMLSVSEWLQKTGATQQKQFYTAVKTGRLDITALPINITPFLSSEEWDQLLSWMPKSFWDEVHIQTAMQNDINGFPVAAVEKMLDKGVKYLWMGPNIHLAMPPFQTPHAFRWKMPSGRSIFVWLNGHYNNGFYLFNDFWREGPIPNSNDTCYRWPDQLDIFKTDDVSMKRAHEQCLKCMSAFEGREPNAGQFERDGFIFNKIEGVYPYETLVVSITNHWRMDNDPPILHLHKFVQRWNELGYQPELRLTTATEAIQDIEREAGDNVETVEGEWPDWWANGTMSVPKELSYYREASRTHRKACSPLFGEMTESDQSCSEKILKNMCIFNEHTYGGWQSISDPNSFEAISAIAEINVNAYRALDDARTLLADRFRRAYPIEQNAVWIANTSTEEYSGWVTIPKNCLRGDYGQIKNVETGEVIPFESIRGGGAYGRPASMSEMSDEYETTDFADNTFGHDVRFWVNCLPKQHVSQFLPCDEQCYESQDTGLHADIKTDENGWPQTIIYNGYDESMIQPGFADFIGVSIDMLAPRWAMMDIFNEADEEKRKAMREHIVQAPAKYVKTVRTESAHDIRFEQSFFYPSLGWAKRILTVSNCEPRAQLVVRMRRLDNPQPEIYYLQMNVSDTKQLPVVSLVNHEFIPGQDQIPNSCMDYYTTDGWIRYSKGDTNWLINSQDAPMISIGKPNCFAKVNRLADNTEIPLFMLFDNTWDTNFVANECGRFVYKFDIRQAKSKHLGKNEADAMSATPVVLVTMRDKQ